MPTLMTVTGLEIPLEPNREYILGRGLDCDIVVLDVVSSRRHAKLSLGESVTDVFVEDLNSKNGTWINEVRVARKTRLKDGSSIRIGATVYLMMKYAKGGPALTDRGVVVLDEVPSVAG